jgi:putative redox protein
MISKTIKTSFLNSRGFLLDARLDFSKNNTLAQHTHFVVFCHCFTCTKETITTHRLSRLLARAGYAVLRFDFTGLGASECDFSQTTFASCQDDLRCAINFLANNYQAPVYLMGHSLGGTTVLSVGAEFSFIKALVCVASPSQPKHVLHHFGPFALTQLKQNNTAKFEVAGREYTLTPSFYKEVMALDLSPLLHAIDVPTLIFSIENDTLVSHDNALQIKHKVGKNAHIVSVKNSNHLLSTKQSTQEVAQKIIDWLTALPSTK